MPDFPSYNQWLGSRPTSLALRNQYNNAKDAFMRGTRVTSPSGTRSTGTPPDSFYGSGGRRSTSTSTPSSGSGSSPSGSGSRATGTRPYTPPGRAAIPTFGGRSTMYPGGTPPPPPRGGTPSPSPSGGSPTPPSGGGERLQTIDQRMADAAKKLAGRRAALKPGMVKPDTNMGRNIKGGIVAAVASHMLEDVGGVGSALMSGDYKRAGQRGLDTLVHTPLGFGLSAGDAASYAATGKAMRDKPTGIVDRVVHGKYLPDSAYGPLEKPKPAAAKNEDNPAFKKPEGVGKPIGASPKQPDSLPDMGRQGRAQNKAMRDPESYLGSAFDATLRKGIDTGRNYLRSQMNKDGLDSDDQSKIMARFDSKIADDKELKLAANKGGIINTIAAKDARRGQRTLEAYRGQRGKYQGNTSYKAMQEKYVK